MKRQVVKFISAVLTGRDFPFAVRKVPYDSRWHVQYYMRNVEGKLYVTYDRVSQAQAIRASKNLVNQYNKLPKKLRGEY